MVKPLSGALLAEKMANGTLTNEEQNAINAQRKKSKEAASLFTKQKEKTQRVVRSCHFQFPL